MVQAWQDLTLYRDPALSGDGNISPRQRVLSLLNEVSQLAFYRSTVTHWRGVADAQYRLEPTLARRLNSTEIEAETENLIERSRTAAWQWSTGMALRAASDLEWLALLQHTGTATPLLDLTADPLVALYFCVRHQPDLDGLLIGFSTSNKKWEDLTTTKETYTEVIGRLRTEGMVGWMVPPVVSERVVVQRSRMLVAPLSDDHPLATISQLVLPSLSRNWGTAAAEAVFSTERSGRRSIPSALGFRVPRDLKESIAEVLSASYGINQETMFPDPGGFAIDRGPSNPA